MQYLTHAGVELIIQMGPPPSPSPHKRARSALTVRARAAPYRRPSVSANSQPGPAGVHSRRNIIRHGSEVSFGWIDLSGDSMG